MVSGVWHAQTLFSQLTFDHFEYPPQEIKTLWWTSMIMIKAWQCSITARLVCWLVDELQRYNHYAAIARRYFPSALVGESCSSFSHVIHFVTFAWLPLCMRVDLGARKTRRVKVRISNEQRVWSAAGSGWHAPKIASNGATISYKLELSVAPTANAVHTFSSGSMNNQTEKVNHRLASSDLWLF